MADFYLFVFIALCIAIIGWSIIRLERIYQFPFFMAATFLSFILPQAIAIAKEPGVFVSESALDRMLIYTSLCVAMCWIGYQSPPNHKWLAKLNIPIDEDKLLKIGIVLLIFGHLCLFTISHVGIQFSEQGTWTGPATILIFFAGVLNIALPLFLLRTLKNPSLMNMALTAIAALPKLQVIILYGRRQPTIAFLVAVGLCLFIAKHYIPPRFLLVVLIPISAYIIPTIGNLRGRFWELVFAGNWDTIQSVSQEGLGGIMEGKILELRNATLVMDYATQFAQYGYGKQLWNAVIFQYVPGQLLGKEFKQSLQLSNNIDLVGFYGYQSSTGTTLTGIGDSFIDFGFLGCLFFALMAYLFKTLWVSTVQEKSIIGTLLYISLIDSAMLGITHGIGRFVNEFIFKCGVLFLISYYCKYSPKIGRPMLM